MIHSKFIARCLHRLARAFEARDNSSGGGAAAAESASLLASDVLVASYPKAGRNWLLFTIANALLSKAGRTEEVSFLNIHELIPELLPGTPLAEGQPRFFAKHELYGGEHVRIVYLARHPADIMVSYYKFVQGRQGRDPGAFSQFIRDRRRGIPAWQNHVQSWRPHWGHVVRYEDMLADSETELRKLLAYAQCPCSDEIVAQAVEKSSFDRMKTVEKTHGLPRATADPNFSFVRRGRFERGQSLFNAADYEYLQRTAGEAMAVFGYE